MQQESLALAGDARGGHQALPHSPGTPCQALLALGCPTGHLHPAKGTPSPWSATCGVTMPRSQCHSQREGLAPCSSPGCAASAPPLPSGSWRSRAAQGQGRAAPGSDNPPLSQGQLFLGSCCAREWSCRGTRGTWHNPQAQQTEREEHGEGWKHLNFLILHAEGERKFILFLPSQTPQSCRRKEVLEKGRRTKLLSFSVKVQERLGWIRPWKEFLGRNSSL